MVAGTDVTINGATAGEYPVGHMALPVKDVGRLLLRCADRPGLVAAVSTFLADAAPTSCRWTSIPPSRPVECSCSAPSFICPV